MSVEEMAPLLSCPFHVEGNSPFTVIHNQPNFPACVNFSYRQSIVSSSDDSDVTILSDVTARSNNAKQNNEDPIKIRLNIVQLKEQSRKSLKLGNYYKAIPSLKTLIDLQDETLEKFHTAATLCDAYCNTHDVPRAIQTLHYIEKCVKLLDISPSRVNRWAEVELHKKEFFKTFIYYIAEVQLHIVRCAKHTDPNEPLVSVRQCIEKMRYLVLCAKDNLNDICCDFVLPVIQEVQRKARIIKGKSLKDHTLFNSWNLYYIACCHAELKQYSKSVDVLTETLSLMDRYMNSSASEYKLYAFCLHNLGFANYQLGNYSDSVTAYERALAVGSKNKSWGEDKLKKIFLVLTKHELKKARYFNGRPKLLKYLKFPDYIYLRYAGVV